jgi:hypothetical protein
LRKIFWTIFHLTSLAQTGSEDHPASWPMGTWGHFSGGKARPGRNANHSPPSNADVVNEYKLYLISPSTSKGVLWYYFTFIAY